MITLEWLYLLTGAVFAVWAVLSARDATNGKRWGNAAFWGLLAASFLFGSHLTDLANGALVLALVGIAGAGWLGRSDPPTTTLAERAELSQRLGNRLFLPALVIPVTAVAGTVLYTYTPLGGLGLFEERRETLILLGLGVLLALAVCYAWIRPPALAPLEEGRRLMDSIGWAAVLPQMLAALGGVFALAGVGDIIGGLAGQVIPEGSLFLSVLVYCLGMVAFTMIMGNAFAAFPVMAAAIGIPVLAVQFGGNVAIIGAVGMLAGFCGTLMTPMAANFNIVPAALLELRSQYGVIRAQVGTAIPLLACNIALIYVPGFSMTALTPSLAAHFARTALGHVAREYPHKLDHVMETDDDARTPRALHPVFFGSYDWHSCVHGWWTLLTLRRLCPDLPEAARIAELADETFTVAKLEVERAYLERPTSAGFERPYGWAWLLFLHLEATRHTDRMWAARLEPLARAFARRFATYLAILTYPIRTGTHYNTAFALRLALDWADAFDTDLAAAMRSRLVHWFAGDRDCPAWEPGGDEFLSGALSEALAMQRALLPQDFARWFAGFLPRAGERQPQTLFTPAVVSDRSDGKIAHLDGLNLSRAWAWRQIACAMGDEGPVALACADTHLEAALPHVAGDYMGEHWLASFALLALLAGSDSAD